MLVDDGKLHWEQKVKEILPDFAVATKAVSEAATILDLVVSLNIQAHDFY